MLAQYFTRVSLALLAVSLCVRVLSKPAQANVQALASPGPLGRAARILLLTAHPDDECMFFAPTITALTSPSADTATENAAAPELFSLCLSVGNADGLGKTRKEELAHSLDVLGVSQLHRWLVDSPDLPDNITVSWDADVIANTIRPYVLGHKIDTILTFDRQGVSWHPNHRSLPRGVKRLIETLPPDHPTPLTAYGLVTVSLGHKYIGPVAALLARLDLALNAFARPGAQGIPAFVADIAQYRTALRAMRQHASQLVWFRWLYVAFSRYMWVNEWARIAPLGA